MIGVFGSEQKIEQKISVANMKILIWMCRGTRDNRIRN